MELCAVELETEVREDVTVPAFCKNHSASKQVLSTSPSRALLRGDVVADARCWKKFTLKLNFVFVHTRAKTVSFTA